MTRRALACTLFAVCLGLIGTALQAAETTVVLFTARDNATEKAVIKDFENWANIRVEVMTGKADELIGQLAANQGGADLFMAVDGGILESAKQKGVFAVTDSPALRALAPVGLRDSDNAWVGVTTRARIIAYAKDRVNPDELSSYFGLADPKWQGKIAVRSSTNLYNQSLTASLIEAYGPEKTAQWTRCIAANLAREPKGGDRDQAKAIYEGVADVAIMNSYYLNQMFNSKDADEVKVAESLGVFFPDQDRAGTHINVGGIGVVKGAKEPEAALRLVEYLLSKRAQEKLSAGNAEFPVNPEAELPPLLEGWGEFKAQEIDFSALLEHKEQAKELLEKSGWK